MKKLALALILAFSAFKPVLAAETVKSPKEVVQAYFQYLHEGKIPELLSLLADDIVWHQPGNSVVSGKYEGKEAVGKLFVQFDVISGGTFKIDNVFEIMSNGELVSATLEFSARQCRYFDYTISMRGVDLMRVVDGKIKEVTLFSADQAKEDDFWGVKQR